MTLIVCSRNRQQTSSLVTNRKSGGLSNHGSCASPEVGMEGWRQVGDIERHFQSSITIFSTPPPPARNTFFRLLQGFKRHSSPPPPPPSSPPPLGCGVLTYFCASSAPIEAEHNNKRVLVALLPLPGSSKTRCGFLRKQGLSSS